MPLEALLTTAAFAPIHDKGWLRVTGPDRLRWLNGMTTNNIAALAPGQGCYTFFLNAQGRILADATAFALEDSILLETASPGSLATHLDHFIIMDDVELEVLPDFHGILIAGPHALTVVSTLGTHNNAAAACATPGPPHTPADPPHLKQTLYAGAPVHLILAHSPLVSIFELWSDPATLTAIRAELTETRLPQTTPEDLHALRILSGTPLYGTDIRNSDSAKDLPQETNQTRALNFAKGCYLGQEIVERIRSRGQVHRTFTGFRLNGELPTTLSTLSTTSSPEKTIGELTSFAATPYGNFALGYIRREALDRGESIQYPGGTAIPSTLPFPISLKRED